MAETAVTSNLGWDNFYSTTTTGALTATTTTIPLATPPTPTEGFLVLDPGGANEIIFYNSVSGNNVIVPTTDDRGRGDSTAQAHSSGITVKMNTVGMMFEALQSGLGLSATFNLPAGVVKNADLATSAGEIGAAWASWTPTWTNLTVGNGTVTAKYTQLGKTVIARVSVAFGSTTSIGGSVSFTLPVTAVAIAAGSPHIGSAIYDDVGTNLYMGVVYEGSTTSGVLRVGNAAATYTGTTVLSSTVPFTWTTSDAINLSLIYEAA